MLNWCNSSNPVFIRRKKFRNRETFQLVESYRMEGKVRQRVIIDLGGKDSVEGAIAVCERRIASMTREIEECREFVSRFDSEPERIKGNVYRSPAVLEARRYWLRRDTIDKFEKRIAQQRERLARLWEVAEEVGIDKQALESARQDQFELMRRSEEERQRREAVLRKLLEGRL